MSGNDDVSETTNGIGNDCNDLLDILSRGDTASNILNYSSDSLTRRKRRPRTAEIGGADSTVALTGDHRERTASPSPRNARTSPSQEIDRYGDGLIRRGSLPPAPPPVADEAGRPSSSGQRRSRRSADYRHASLHTVDREHCIRLARHIDYQQLPQPCTKTGSEGGINASITSVVSVPDDGAVGSCNGDSFPSTGMLQIPAVVDNWPNLGARSNDGTLPVNSQTLITENRINGNGFNEVDDNSNVCDPRTSVTRANEFAVSGTLPVRRKSCLKNSAFNEQRLDEMTGCSNDLPQPVGTVPSSSHGTILFRQSSLDGTRSSSNRIEAEAHMIDVAVLEFQTRQVPEREALKNRLRKLTQI